jgi:TonB family protein
MSTNPIAAEGHSQDGNKRYFERRKIETLTYVGLGPGNGGVVFDVSEGGMAFQGIQRLQADELLCINFKLPGIRGSMESITEVAWLNKTGKGGGLRFIYVPDDTLANIKEWFSPQTMSGGLPEKIATSAAPITTTASESSPPIQLVAIPENDSDAAAGSSSGPVQDSTLSPVSAMCAVEDGASVTANTTGSIGVAETPVPSPILRDPSLYAGSSGKKIAPFARKLLASFAVMATLGAILFLSHGKAQHFSTIEPQAKGEVGYKTPIPASAPSAPAAEHFVNEPAAQKSTGLAGVPPKAAKQLKTGSSKASTVSERLAASAKGAMPRPTMLSRTADSSLPSVTPPLGLEPGQRLSAMLPEMPSLTLNLGGPAGSNGKLEPAQLLSHNDPLYPAGAKASGRVELHFTIGTDGWAHNVTVVTGNALLARAAVEAVQGWRYSPARLGGKPVQSEASTEFVFKRKGIAH